MVASEEAETTQMQDGSYIITYNIRQMLRYLVLSNFVNVFRICNL